VLDQVGLSEECAPHLVVTDNVPPMQGMFIAQVRNEFGDRHASSGPKDVIARVQFENVSNEIPHSLLLDIEAMEKIVMIHGLKGTFALFEATSSWHRVPLQVWVKMSIDLHRNTRDVCGDLMGRPSVA
jgi:hypothetical protein